MALPSTEPVTEKFFDQQSHHSPTVIFPCYVLTSLWFTPCKTGAA